MKTCLSHPVKKKWITDDTRKPEVSHYILEQRTTGVGQCRKTFPSLRNTHRKILKGKVQCSDIDRKHTVLKAS